jgi:hypothetical protein
VNWSGGDEAFTNLIKHLVTFVEDETVDTSETQLLVADKSVQTTRSGHHNVGMGLLVGQNLVVLLDGNSTVEDGRLDLGHVLAEAIKLVANLESQLTSVAKDQHGGLALDRVDLLKRRQDEDGGLTETGFGLAEDIGSQDGLRNDGLLDCWSGGLRLDRTRRRKAER